MVRCELEVRRVQYRRQADHEASWWMQIVVLVSPWTARQGAKGGWKTFGGRERQEGIRWAV